MVRRYANLIRKLQPKNIFELGIWQGGSCIFFQRLAAARKLVSIDLSDTRISAMDEYIERYGLHNVLRPYYGVNQADTDRVRRLVEEEFGYEPLDLVVDDASHFLDETRTSFNTLFPRVRPGGAYVIEDWPWAHVAVGKNGDGADGLYPDREPMTKLIFEIVLACASTRGLIKNIGIDCNSATIWRGETSIDAEDFNIANCSAARGRALIGS
jgi:hypothetical protein